MDSVGNRGWAHDKVPHLEQADSLGLRWITFFKITNSKSTWIHVCHLFVLYISSGTRVQLSSLQTKYFPDTPCGSLTLLHISSSSLYTCTCRAVLPDSAWEEQIPNRHLRGIMPSDAGNWDSDQSTDWCLSYNLKPVVVWCLSELKRYSEADGTWICWMSDYISPAEWGLFLGLVNPIPRQKWPYWRQNVQSFRRGLQLVLEFCF